MLIEIDTREQKTPTHIDKLLERYETLHPQLSKGFEYAVVKLDCDIKIMDYAAEIKWGHDLVASLNSKHFLKQLTKMREEKIAANLYLLCANTSTYAITTVEMARATTICQQLQITLLYSQDPLDVLEKFIDIVREGNTTTLLPAEVIVEGTKKAPWLVRSFAQIDGVSLEFAFFFIRSRWTCWADVVEDIQHHPFYIREQLLAYYKRNMNVLEAEILKRLVEGE